MPHWRNVGGKPKAKPSGGNGLCPIPEGWYHFCRYYQRCGVTGQFIVEGHTYACSCGRHDHWYNTGSNDRIIVCSNPDGTRNEQLLANFRRID